MNCFEWQNHVSDFIDGSLPSAEKSEADHHLSGCKDCTERHERFRLILNQIASQPRSSLPIPIRKSPLSAAIPKIDVAWLGRSQWEKIPWYLRTTLEGVGIVILILAGISSGPRIRSLYERGIEKSLSEFSQSFSSESGEPVPAAAPLLRGNVTTAQADPAAAEFASGDEAASDDDSDSDAQGGSQSGGDEDIHVGNSEIWRFILKTDSPHEIRPKIVKMLTDLKVASDTPGLGGIEAPGGIQFDLLIPQTALPSLKHQLQAMAPQAPAELAKTPAGETFTWYKNRSKQKLPDRKTRIVIWLSQM